MGDVSSGLDFIQTLDCSPACQQHSQPQELCQQPCLGANTVIPIFLLYSWLAEDPY